VMSPMVLPRNILDNTIHDLLEYIEPKLTPKTYVYKETLENMLKRPTFEEQWPDTYLESIKNGKKNIEFLEKIRNQKITFSEIMNDEARDWWNTL